MAREIAIGAASWPASRPEPAKRAPKLAAASPVSQWPPAKVAGAKGPDWPPIRPGRPAHLAAKSGVFCIINGRRFPPPPTPAPGHTSRSPRNQPQSKPREANQPPTRPPSNCARPHRLPVYSICGPMQALNSINALLGSTFGAPNQRVRAHTSPQSQPPTMATRAPQPPTVARSLQATRPLSLGAHGNRPAEGESLASGPIRGLSWRRRGLQFGILAPVRIMIRLMRKLDGPRPWLPAAIVLRAPSLARPSACLTAQIPRANLYLAGATLPCTGSQSWAKNWPLEGKLNSPPLASPRLARWAPQWGLLACRGRSLHARPLLGQPLADRRLASARTPRDLCFHARDTSTRRLPRPAGADTGRRYKYTI